jgi:hypothetical protein
LYGAETWDISENTSEIPGKFWNVLPDKDERDQLGRSGENELLQSQGGNEHPKYNKKEKS